jgi:hypothetical protein
VTLSTTTATLCTPWPIKSCQRAERKLTITFRTFHRCTGLYISLIAANDDLVKRTFCFLIRQSEQATLIRKRVLSFNLEVSFTFSSILWGFRVLPGGMAIHDAENTALGFLTVFWVVTLRKLLKIWGRAPIYSESRLCGRASPQMQWSSGQLVASHGFDSK